MKKVKLKFEQDDTQRIISELTKKNIKASIAITRTPHGDMEISIEQEEEISESTIKEIETTITELFPHLKLKKTKREK